MALGRARWLIIVAIATVGVIGAPNAAGNAVTPDACGRNEAKTAVFAEMDLPNGEALWQHFPSFGRAPEISNYAGPLHVVAFAGVHQGVPAVQAPAPPGVQAPAGPVGYNSVVCVVFPSGNVTYYANIPYADFRP